MNCSQSFESRRACPLCASENLKTALNFEEINVKRCNSCDFMFSDHVFDEASLRQFYTKGYGGLRHRQGQQVNASVNSWIIESAINPIVGKVLDVGSGYGLLLKSLLDKHEIEPTGVELSETELKYAKAELGIETLADLRELPPDNRFDLVTAFEVIEHIQDPRAFLESLATLVKPGGHLIIGTDNFNSAIATSMGIHFPKWIPHQHVSFFEGNTLSNLIDSLPAMKVISKRSFTPWEFYFRRTINWMSGGRLLLYNFSLRAELESENSRPFRLFALRQYANKLWAIATTRNNTNGEMMFLVAHKAIS